MRGSISADSTRSALLKAYPQSREILETEYTGLESSVQRQALYVHKGNLSFSFENPVYGGEKDQHNQGVTKKGKYNKAAGSNMGRKDFLSAIPSFRGFTDEQLNTLERGAVEKSFKKGDVVFRQGEEGESFYIISEGSVDVIVADHSASKALRAGRAKALAPETQSLGKVVNRLNEGSCFGERALMTSEPRAATILVTSNELVCLVFPRSIFESIISGSEALLGDDSNVNVDWSKDNETRSLFRHIENIVSIVKATNASLSPKMKRVLYELMTVFTPELSPDEVISRMVMTVKAALKVDRVGLFVLSEDKRSIILKVSERSKGVRLPVRGIAGCVLQTNSAIRIADAYQDARFDATMDRRTGYRTRQILGVPLRHPLSGEAIGLLQVNNRLDDAQQPCPDSFTPDHQKMIELAAEQLSELLHGREDVFIQTGSSASDMSSYGHGVGDGLVLLNTADVQAPLQVELHSLSLNQGCRTIIVQEAMTSVEVEVSLYLGLSLLCDPVRVPVAVPASYRTPAAGYSAAANKSSKLDVLTRIEFGIAVRNLPRAARVLFKVVGSAKKARSALLLSSKSGAAKEVSVGWVAAILFDYKGCMNTVLCGLELFPGDIDSPITTTLNNVSGATSVSNKLSMVLAPDLVLSADAMTPRVKIVHSMPSRTEPMEIAEGDQLQELSAGDNEALDGILQLSFNPMSSSIMTEEDKEFLWDVRYNILNRAELLPAFVMSVRWQSAERVQELYDLLDLWAPPSPTQALQLLDRRFMDSKVRAYAVHRLEDLKDDELALYMLQLCQQLKFENYVDSALSRFLLRRALGNKKLIGHIYFWLLESEVHNKDVCRRFVILLQVYLQNCGSHRMDLGHQMFVMKKLEEVAQAVIVGDSKESRKEILRARLSEIILPDTFKLPLNPHLQVCGIDVSRCRVMESKKKPLWLTLKNTDGSDVVLMLKVGDDLRQDALILQLLRVMDDLWRREGLDLKMQLYDCLSTGDERGLLQVVLNANTLGNILIEATDKQTAGLKSGSLRRKLNSAMRALSDFSVLRQWIESKVNEEMEDGDGSAEGRMEAEIEERVQNFIISTAAYCVASYVLGLGDRHNDNLMMTKSGHFFHIDFGHILGNFKSKMGVKRERAPFVFTPAMKAVMAAEGQYELFCDLCCDVYNILREHSVLLVSLFSLAIPCNLPELQKEQDVMWIYEKLLVGASDEEASAHFRAQLEVSLNTRGTRINDAAHMLAHA